MTGDQHYECAVYNPSIGDRLRVLIRYGGLWRPIFWFQFKQDGSLYLGPRFINIDRLRTGRQTAQGGSFTIKYADGQEVSDPRLLRTTKISFHASGIIHVAGDRLFRDSLRNIQDQQELCHVAFQHPNCFAPDSKIQRRDILLDYAFDEQRPLCGLMVITPTDKAKRIEFPGVSYQRVLAFPFSGLSGVPDLILQLILYHEPISPWPPETYVVFTSINETINSSENMRQRP